LQEGFVSGFAQDFNDEMQVIELDQFRSAQQLVALGVDHHRAPIALRERLAFRPDELPAALAELNALVSEGFILSTCNRTEVYVLAERHDAADRILRFFERTRGVAPKTVEGVSFVHTGREAIRHLCEVACGLQSMMIGEPQILTQLRAAIDASRDQVALGPVLSRAGAEALRAGKRARTETKITRSAASIPRGAVDLALNRLGSLGNRHAVVIGAGEMASHSARLLREAGIADLVILNRTVTNAEELARIHKGRFGPLSAIAEEISRADLIISAATVQNSFLVDAHVLPDDGKPRLIVDLGVPRTVDPAIRGAAGVDLVDVDDLDRDAAARSTARTGDIAAIERIVEETVAAFTSWLDERSVAPTVSALREHAESIRRAELEKALRKLGGLSERDQEVVSALSVAIVNKLLHNPTTRLKRGERRNELASSARALFDLSPETPVTPFPVYRPFREEPLQHDLD
jgi:glutamyl-tRNA reductase